MPDIRKTRRFFLTGLGGLAIGSAASPLLHAEQKHKPDEIGPGPRVSGGVYPRAHPDYERRRQNTVWQALKPERYPDTIVHALSEDDIVETIHSVCPGISAHELRRSPGNDQDFGAFKVDDRNRVDTENGRSPETRSRARLAAIQARYDPEGILPPPFQLNG